MCARTFTYMYTVKNASSINQRNRLTQMQKQRDATVPWLQQDQTAIRLRDAPEIIHFNGWFIFSFLQHVVTEFACADCASFHDSYPYFSFFFCLQELDPKAGTGCVMTIGQLVRSFMLKLEWYGTLYPRIPVPIQKEIERRLQELNLCDDHKRTANESWPNEEDNRRDR